VYKQIILAYLKELARKIDLEELRTIKKLFQTADFLAENRNRNF
jgi:acyl carrier protein